MANIFGELDYYRKTPAQRERVSPPLTIKKAEAPQVTDVKYSLAKTVEDFDSYMHCVFENNIPCAFDIETAPYAQFREEKYAALDAHKSDIVGISFSHTPGTGIYVALGHLKNNFELPKDLFLQMLAKVFFYNDKILKIAHNIAFESAFFYKHNIAIQLPAYDTIVAAQLTLKNPNEFRDLHDSGLKTLSANILKIQQTKFEEVTNGKHFDELDPEDSEVINYGAADSDHSLRLYHYFEDWFALNIPGHSYYCREVDTPACIYTGMMKYNGILVDRPLMIQKKAEAERKIAELRAKILEFTGPGIDIGKNASTKSLETWLYGIRGYPCLSYTEKGGKSLDDEAIQLLIDWCKSHGKDKDIEFFRHLQEYRKWGKLLSTYIDGYMDYINSVTGKIHADLLPCATDTSRFASQRPNLQNCFDDKTEILTPRGWVLFKDLLPDDKVAQWENGEISFVLPLSYVTQDYTGDLVSLSNQHIDLCVTPDHRCLLQNRKTKIYKVFSAEEYPEDKWQIHGGVFQGFGEKKLSLPEIIILTAVQADGYYHDGGIEFCFSKQRKIDRLLYALKTLNIPYTQHKDKIPKDGCLQKKFRILKNNQITWVFSLLGKEKCWGSWLLDYDKKTLQMLCAELYYWDGCFTRKNMYSSSYKTNTDWVQILYTLMGCRAKQRIYHNGNPNSKLNYQIDLVYRNYSLTTNIDKNNIPYNGKVYCVEVPSSYIVVRRNGCVVVTGNCPRYDNDPIGVRKFFISSPDNIFIDADFSQIELRVGAFYCRDEKMLEVYRTGGDIHSQTTSVLYNIPLSQAKDKNAEHYKERRTISKNFNFGSLYGLFAKGAQKNLKFKAGIEKTEAECEELINNLMRGYPGIREWQAKTKNRAAEFKYSDTLFGYRRFLRGINSGDWGIKSYWERCALNSPVQGTAAGILKLALARLLPFIKDNPWLKPLLQVHDELLFECPPEKKALAVKIIKSCMEAQPCPEFDVPIVAEGAWGSCFGSLEELGV